MFARPDHTPTKPGTYAPYTCAQPATLTLARRYSFAAKAELIIHQ